MKSNLCGSVLSMPFFDVFGWSIPLASLMEGIWTSKSCGVGLGVLLLGARRMIFLEGSLSHISREIGKLCFFDVFFVYSYRMY